MVIMEYHDPSVHDRQSKGVYWQLNATPQQRFMSIVVHTSTSEDGSDGACHGG